MHGLAFAGASTSATARTIATLEGLQRTRDSKVSWAAWCCGLRSWDEVQPRKGIASSPLTERGAPGRRAGWCCATASACLIRSVAKERQAASGAGQAKSLIRRSVGLPQSPFSGDVTVHRRLSNDFAIELVHRALETRIIASVAIAAALADTSELGHTHSH